MAYYTALITAWNGATQPPTGVAGTALTGGMTTAQKIAAVNGWTITGTVPTTMTATGAQVLNCVVWSEFAALTASQQSNFLALCTNSGALLGGSANTTKILPGMIIAYFGGPSGTVANLSAMAAATVTPWWQASTGGNLSGPISQADVTAAGLT